MTTLHGLLTISDLFAGFNLINTGVVTCLIMCQNARKIAQFQGKKSKIFLGWGTAPPQTPHWDGNTPSPNPTTSSPAAPRSTCPPNENNGSASGAVTKTGKAKAIYTKIKLTL